MTSAPHALCRKLESMGYLQPIAEKIKGQWRVTAQDPLNKVSVTFERLGSSVESALAACSKLARLPNFYVCAHSTTCQECGVIDKPTGYTDSLNGDFIHRCRSCNFEWVVSTAEEEIAAAEARMHEASEVLNPVFRTFLKGKIT